MNFIDMKSTNLLAIFYIWANIVSIIVCGMLLLNSMKNKQAKQRYFNNIVFFLIIYFIGDSIWALAYFNIVENADIIIKFARMIYYLSSGVIAYSWLMYVEILLGSPLMFKKKRMLFLIPIIISSISTILICIFLNPAEKNINGYLAALGLVIVPFIYILFPGIHSLTKLIKCNNKNTIKQLIPLAIWPFVVIAVSIFQVFIAELPIYCFGAIAVTVFLYIYSQNAIIFTDGLTGLNNRNKINNYIHELDDECFVIMIDVDKFKLINDTYGHLEGDRALITTAKALKKETELYGYFLARYGGDEFIIIAKTINEEEIINLYNKINEELKNNDLKYKINISFGYSFRKKGMDIKECISKADEMLYYDKNNK